MRFGVLYTRWGSIDVTATDVDAYAELGVNRLVIAPSSADLDEQRYQLSALAGRLKAWGGQTPTSARSDSSFSCPLSASYSNSSP
jgi:hypothetical protein